MVRTWRVPISLSGNAARISAWVRVITGMELDQTGRKYILTPESWHAAHQELMNLGGRPDK